MYFAETGKAIVQYENGDGSQHVMELIIQRDVSTCIHVFRKCRILLFNFQNSICHD